MLARVADNLYWIGRYIERSEHCARYLKVQYYSTLDAPMSHNKDFTLRSIMFMAGADFDHEIKIHTKDVLRRVIFDGDNQNSLFSIAYRARENARSIRNNISSELWEAINRWYLFYKVKDYQNFDAKHIYEFTSESSLHTGVIKSTIDMTLLRNDIWRFIKIGIYMERGFQILRILRSKISDNRILSDNGANIPLMRYQWTTLLKSLEAFDVYNQYYRDQEMTEASIFRHLLSNELFPRSLAYSLSRMERHLTHLSGQPLEYPNLLAKFEADKVACQEFDAFDDVDEVISHIDEGQKCLTHFHNDIAGIYFN